MIINNTYFYGDIYLPQAKPSLLPENAISTEFNNYIESYSEECLLKLLGYILFEEFASKLDSATENGLKAGTEEKWNELLNGKTFVDSNGNNVKWRGMRFNQIGNDKPKSFIADYVYYQFLIRTQSTPTSTGQKTVKVKNAEEADVAPALSRTWNRFVESVQDVQQNATIIEKSYGYGVDYFTRNKSQYVTLNQFINEMNLLDSTTYENYEAETFDLTNSFGI